MSIKVIGRPKEKVLLCSNCLELFRVFFRSCRFVPSRSCLFWPLTTIYNSLRFLQTTISQNVLICKFTKNERQIRFYYKLGKILFQNEGALMCCKVGQVLLQRGTTFFITKQDKWYYKVEKLLQSGATFIIKWVRYYKVGAVIINYDLFYTCINYLENMASKYIDICKSIHLSKILDKFGNKVTEL